MIRIDVDDHRVVRALDELIQHGHNPRPALQEINETDRLHNEIHYRVSGSGIEWGSNLTYAAMQHFGG